MFILSLSLSLSFVDETKSQNYSSHLRFFFPFMDFLSFKNKKKCRERRVRRNSLKAWKTRQNCQ